MSKRKVAKKKAPVKKAPVKKAPVVRTKSLPDLPPPALDAVECASQCSGPVGFLKLALSRHEGFTITVVFRDPSDEIYEKASLYKVDEFGLLIENLDRELIVIPWGAVHQVVFEDK